MWCELNSECKSGVSLTQDLARIRLLCVWDLQPWIPEGPEPSDAPMAPQGAVEAVEEGESDDEEANADDCVNERCSGIFVLCVFLLN